PKGNTLDEKFVTFQLEDNSKIQARISPGLLQSVEKLFVRRYPKFNHRTHEGHFPYFQAWFCPSYYKVTRYFWLILFFLVLLFTVAGVKRFCPWGRDPVHETVCPLLA
ncbi:MAG: hypothetical protein Q8935_21310, partial [Bacillota bacterium]|nr:hypothetical protein [Bacillota bacterium]